MFNTRIAAGVCLLSLLLLADAPAAHAIINRTYDVAPGGMFELEAESARVAVLGSSDDQVRILISRGSDDDEQIHADFFIEFAQAGDRVSLNIHRREDADWFRTTRPLQIDVVLPNRFDVDLKTSGGSVAMADLSGRIDTRTSGGSLRFQNVDGPVFGHTSGGSIDLDGTSADAVLRTSGGSIRVGEVTGTINAKTSGGSIQVMHGGGSLTARTSGGSIRIGSVDGSVQAKTSGGGITVGMAAQPEADSELTTSGGSVTVMLDPTLALALDARSSGGRVVSELPVTIVGEASKRRLTGDINGGGPTLRLRTSGGSVHVVSPPVF